jgi:hypothetical protein
VCAVAAVLSEYAVGPAIPENTAVAAMTARKRRSRRSPKASPAAAISPVTRTAYLIQGCQESVRLSRVYDHSAVTTTVPESTKSAARFRSFHRVLTPIPISAAIAGARATV